MYFYIAIAAVLVVLGVPILLATYTDRDKVLAYLDARIERAKSNRG